MRRVALLYAAWLILVAAGAAGAGSSTATPGASARAFAIKVVVAGAGGGTREVTAPPDSVQFGSAFSYGSAVATGAVTASASASAADSTATAGASAQVDSLSLFGGEVTVARVLARASAAARSGKGTGDVSRAAISGLAVFGQPVAASPGARIPLGDWGHALTLAQSATPAPNGYRALVTALEVRLTAEHGGLPAGSSILVGYAEAAAQAAAPPPAPKVPAPSPPEARAEARPEAGTQAQRRARPRARASAQGRAAKRKASPRRRRAAPTPRRPIPTIVTKLTPDANLTRTGYVFPVFGPASYTDTFGAPRAIVGWHHGEDIFASVGAPVLAVTSGWVFSVGWNDVGGNRLWLRDRHGNEFYYAHLSAFSPLAVNGAQVRAGDVLGFVGNTGDAETTPPHLHFEVHPVDYLGLGYDGVVDPNPLLARWRRLERIRYVVGGGWLALTGRESRAPQPGAFLLSALDISSANGLDARSLRQAMTVPTSAEAAAPTAPRGRPSPASPAPAGDR